LTPDAIENSSVDSPTAAQTISNKILNYPMQNGHNLQNQFDI